MRKSLVKYSKFLSLVLRHDPSAAGLVLDDSGWADVDALLAACARRGLPRDVVTLREVVETNDKRRFALSADGKRIRARQGHSLEVDLGLRPQQPPDVLYHGTAHRFLQSILTSGIQPRQRQYVHLSKDVKTAVEVGRRHGRPVVLAVDARGMSDAGHDFFLSENGVWLTREVSRTRVRQISLKEAEQSHGETTSDSAPSAESDASHA